MKSEYIIIFLLLLLLVFIFWLVFFKNRKKNYGPFLPVWKSILRKKVGFYNRLSEAEKSRFETSIQQFFDDVTISGVEVSIDDTDRLLVAASAVIPLFGFPGWRYFNLNEVLLYEGTFNEEYQTTGEDRNVLGMVGSGAMNRMMILSKTALHQGFEHQQSRNNVGIHEFVHLLDKADGGNPDGILAALLEKQFVIPWLKLMHQEIQMIKSGHSDINPYGATNEAEFLSVVSEYFFNQPHLFKEKHPELFAQLEKIYRQDLA